MVGMEGGAGFWCPAPGPFPSRRMVVVDRERACPIPDVLLPCQFERPGATSYPLSVGGQLAGREGRGRLSEKARERASGWLARAGRRQTNMALPPCVASLRTPYPCSEKPCPTRRLEICLRMECGWSYLQSSHICPCVPAVASHFYNFNYFF